jgi:hypothetical protein
VSPRRAVSALLGLIAAAVLLVGCDKPQPAITVHAGTVAATVPAQPTCTILTAQSCPPDADKQRTLTARGGSELVLDVPSELAKRGYLVAAYTTDGKKNTPLRTPGASTGPITGKKEIRLTVPDQHTGSYFLQVTALPPSRRLTTWLVLVQLTA